jgi:hypothetical protein
LQHLQFGVHDCECTCVVNLYGVVYPVRCKELLQLFLLRSESVKVTLAMVIANHGIHPRPVLHGQFQLETPPREINCGSDAVPRGR